MHFFSFHTLGCSWILVNLRVGMQPMERSSIFAKYIFHGLPKIQCFKAFLDILDIPKLIGVR